MSEKDKVTIFAEVNPDVHAELGMLAARYRIGKLELYSQALSFAARDKKFAQALEKIYTPKGNIK